MASTPHSDSPAGAPLAVPSWAAEASEAGPAPRPVVNAPAQLPLFATTELAPAAPRVRRARLPGRIEALLKKGRAAPSATPPPDTGTLPGSSWPDSFFDADPGRDS